jgi:type III restriction enzyme
MMLQFKLQQYQTDAVDAVVGCFAGQPKIDGISYRIDPGRLSTSSQAAFDLGEPLGAGLRNSEIQLPPDQLLENVRAIQRRSGLPQAKKLEGSKAAPGSPNLDIEMETGRARPTSTSRR